jgi:chromosomal replication initiation ATPase DnaA
MDAEKEVKKLFRNINVGVSKLTLEKFNKIVSNVLAKHSEKGEYEISQSLKIVAKYYNIPEDHFMTKARGDIYTAKMLLFKILNHTLGISAQRIAKYFNRYPNSITHALHRFEKLNPEKRARDKKVFEDYLEIKKRIQLFINEENA